jgi:hypothetical protein
MPIDQGCLAEPGGKPDQALTPIEAKQMKNVQIIDGADNCSYSIYSFTDDEFSSVFTEPGQDVEFIEDVIARLGDDQAGKLLRPVWDRPVRKTEVVGIHGTLFYELTHKKRYYPTKKEEEIVT